MYTIERNIWGLKINKEEVISFQKTLKGRSSGMSIITIMLPLLFLISKILEYLYNKSRKTNNISNEN